MRDLLPCPFCGSCELENLDAARYGAPVHCIECGARGPCKLADVNVLPGAENGLDAWDTRLGPVNAEDIE